MKKEYPVNRVWRKFHVEIKKAKEKLRQEIVLKVQQWGAQKRSQASQQATDYLKLLSKNYLRVVSIASFGWEIDLWAFNEWLMERQKLCLIRQEVSGLFSVCRVQSKEELVKHPLGFCEPQSSLCSLKLHTHDLVLCPGVVFDVEGYRLGRGKGVYDRWLASVDPFITTIGVGFACQQVIDLKKYIENHDVRLKDVALFG